MRALLVYSNRTRDLILAPPIGLSYVAPPYCRILPKLLGFPPLHALRRRHPSVGSLPRRLRAA